ncbi:alpha/beta fold hydrolase [Microbacterium lemovicicum]|uniref:alpha/beta fold hydrolase n=1 Tax=Microbacterium lemovicicum TaxID=1072463 RepID=UPI0013E028DC|nr:alpha/beta fold hydrolase [Microbacterium lemovicicum]
MEPSRPARRSAALLLSERAIGLRRVTVETATGPVVVRAGRKAGGPAVVLLHGAAGSWTTWTPLVAASDASARPLSDLVIPDLPGWGESRSLPAGAGIGELSEAVVLAVRSLGYTSWHVVGHSLGGFVALDIAATEPDATLSVTLVSPTGRSVTDAVRHPLRAGRRLPGFAGMLLAMRFLAALPADGRGLLRTLRRAGLIRRLASPLFASPRYVHSSVADALADEIRPESFVRAAKLAARYDTRVWRRITAAVRSVRGRHDVFSADSDAAAFVVDIPDFAERRLDDAGHFAHIEDPAAVLGTMAEAKDERMPRLTAVG